MADMNYYFQLTFTSDLLDDVLAAASKVATVSPDPGTSVESKLDALATMLQDIFCVDEVDLLAPDRAVDFFAIEGRAWGKFTDATRTFLEYFAALGGDGCLDCEDESYDLSRYRFGNGKMTFHRGEISFPTDPFEKPTVYVATLTTKHGVDISVHRSEAGAEEAVHEYVSYWWDEEMGEAEMPADHKAAVDAYFDAVGEREFYDIETSPLMA
jgi:hypothetical protein